MSKKKKTAWDDVPAELRKKTILKGAVIAFAGVLAGGVIAFAGIFNPMAGITTGEPEPEIDIHSVATWEVPEGAVEKNSDNSTANVSETVIKFNVDKGQKYYYMAAWSSKEWSDLESDETLIKEEQDDGSAVYWESDEYWYDENATCVSPDGKTIISVWVTNTTDQVVIEENNIEQGDQWENEEFKKWREAEFEEFKDFVHSIKWKQ